MTQTSSPVRRMASEFVVIVLGVLVALGLESAWQERQDRTREVSVIQDLTIEFRRNRSLLVRDLEENRTQLAAAEEWSAAESSGGALPPDSASAFMEASIRIFRFDPEDGVLRSALETGGLEILRSDELRSALGGWFGRVEEARQTALDATNARHALLGELYDTAEGAGSELRRRLVLRSYASLRRTVVWQQESLLLELDRVLSLLEVTA